MGKTIIYIDLYSPICGRQKNMRKNKHRYIYNKKEKNEEKNSAQMFSYYIQ